MSKIRLLDTFAWVGGFHLALEQSIWKENVECVGFSEIDKFATQVYKERFPDSPELGSITDLDIQALPAFDLLTWGFPCQDVSVAWKQSLEWWRTVLVEYLLQILEKKQPKYFVFENVKGLMSKKFDEFRESIFDRIEKAGYWFTYKVLNTKNFWLPQNRERVFIVWELARTTWHFQFPKWKELTTFLKDVLEEEVDEKFHLNRWEKIFLNTINNPVNKLHQSYVWDIKINESCRRIYSSYWIAPTIATSQWWNTQAKVEHNWICRKLTPTEYTRLQWFPDGWSTDFVSNSQAYKQMWNAISVPVVKAIFDNLF